MVIDDSITCLSSQFIDFVKVVADISYFRCRSNLQMNTNGHSLANISDNYLMANISDCYSLSSGAIPCLLDLSFLLVFFLFVFVADCLQCERREKGENNL